MHFVYIYFTLFKCFTYRFFFSIFSSQILKLIEVLFFGYIRRIENKKINIFSILFGFMNPSKCYVFVRLKIWNFVQTDPVRRRATQWSSKIIREHARNVSIVWISLIGSNLKKNNLKWYESCSYIFFIIFNNHHFPNFVIYENES